MHLSIISTFTGPGPKLKAGVASEWRRDVLIQTVEDVHRCACCAAHTYEEALSIPKVHLVGGGPIIYNKNMVFLLILLLLFAPEDSFAKAREYKRSFTSPVYTMTRTMWPMHGPFSSRDFFVEKRGKKDGLVWITGHSAQIMDKSGKKPVDEEFMCHSNLNFVDKNNHRQRLGIKPRITNRIFTLSQGQMEVDFPEGFGIPVYGDEKLQLTTQVVNLNHPGKRIEVRHKTDITFVRDKDTETPMKPLYKISAFGMALLNGEDCYYWVKTPNPKKHGPGCIEGENAETHVYKDPYGRQLTGHWVVPPGRQVNRTLVTKQMNLPYSTTIHHILFHMHPFAESLELRDLTMNKTVFKSEMRSNADKIRLDEVQTYYSKEGIPIFKGHEYELISVYNNTSDKDQTAMAIMFMYVLDKDFERPTD